MNMFTCDQHGWVSMLEPCPQCQPRPTSAATDSVLALPQGKPERKEEWAERVNFIKDGENFIASMVNFPQIVVQMKHYHEMVTGISELFQHVISKAQSDLNNGRLEFVEFTDAKEWHKSFGHKPSSPTGSEGVPATEETEAWMWDDVYEILNSQFDLDYNFNEIKSKYKITPRVAGASSQKQEIERLKGLIKDLVWNDAFRCAYRLAGFPKDKSEENANNVWGQFKTENNL